MRIVKYLLIFIFSTAKVYAQSTAAELFLSNKKSIYSIIYSIDNNKDLLHGMAEGNTKGEEGFDCNIKFYYYKNSKEIIKLEYNQYSEVQTNTLFYYSNHHLIIINEDGSLYYYIENKFMNKNGVVIDTEKSELLIEFEKNTREGILEFFKRYNFKM